MKVTYNQDHQAPREYDSPPMSQREFRDFRDLVKRETGISLASNKQHLLRSRLRKRLLHHNLPTFREYFELIQNRDAKGLELHELINSVTTNKTHFFREEHHFSFLTEKAFPEFQKLAKTSGKKRLRIWSAACSTGEEPYSIAATVRDFRPFDRWNVRILASDIDSTCLRKASQGTYQENTLTEIPLEQLRRMFLKGRGNSAGSFRARPELREMLTFRRINFAEHAWPIRTQFDIIFCRNAMIYFDRDFQDRLLRRFLKYLSPHGYLILGHSENVSWMKDLEAIGQTIYRPRVRAADNATCTSTPPRDAKGRSTPTPNTTLSTALVGQTASKNSSRDRYAERKAIVAGDVFASGKHMEISTLLGSCIASCLYDPNVRVGGMNHFLLPEGSGDHADTACYGINAMELLINELMQLGAQRERMVARLYGGARVMGDKLWSSRIGEKNVDFVRKYLTTEGIPILEQRVGGNSALRVVMVADEGEVHSTELESEHSRKLMRQDMQVRKKTNNEAQTGDSDQITLF